MSGKSVMRLVVALTTVAIALIVWWSDSFVAEKPMEPTYRSDRLFKPYGDAVYSIAQKIERGQAISVSELKALPDGVNSRYGEEITLLFHALGARNVEAIDKLLEAGADPYMIDRPSTGSERDFVYYLGMYGHPTDRKKGLPFINQLISLYLKHGGDPNRRFHGPDETPLITDLALTKNYEGINLLLEAGADPWAENDQEENAMTRLASDMVSQMALNQLIDHGYFNNVPIKKIKNFMQSLSGYLPRGDEISLANQAIGRRVLKRYPQYIDDEDTKRLFQGPIPWQEILNEQ